MRAGRTLQSFLLASALAVTSAGVAEAHIVSSRLGDFYGGVLHPVLGLPDLILWLALGILAGVQPTPLARWLVLVFPAGLVSGFAVGVWSGLTPDPLVVDAGLMVGLGLVIAASVRLPGPVLLALGFGLAVFRGAANAGGLEAGTDLVLFAAGMTAVGYAAITLLAAGCTDFVRSGAGWRTIAVRAGGSWIAAIGLMVSGYAIAVPH